MSCGRNPPADRRPDWLAVSLTGVQPMIRFMTVAVCLVLASPGLDAADKEESRLEESGMRSTAEVSGSSLAPRRPTSCCSS